MPPIATHAIQQNPPFDAVVALLEGAGLPFSDLSPAHMSHFFHGGAPDAPTGIIGVELLGTSALLRSLVVRADVRSAGLGSALVKRAETHARASGAVVIYLLTTTAEPYFRRHGYVPADRASAPEEIRATTEFSQLCPASSAFLVKALR